MGKGCPGQKSHSFISPNLIKAGNFLAHFLPVIHTCNFYDNLETKTHSHKAIPTKGWGWGRAMLLPHPACQEELLSPEGLCRSDCDIDLKQ